MAQPRLAHISLDHEDERIKHFVRSLPVGPDGSVLELDGRALLRVLPAAAEPVDAARLAAAIRRRRDASRALNAEWEAADRALWDQIPDDPA